MIVLIHINIIIVIDILLVMSYSLNKTKINELFRKNFTVQLLGIHVISKRLC